VPRLLVRHAGEALLTQLLCAQRARARGGRGRGRGRPLRAHPGRGARARRGLAARGAPGAGPGPTAAPPAEQAWALPLSFQRFMRCQGTCAEMVRLTEAGCAHQHAWLICFVTLARMPVHGTAQPRLTRRGGRQGDVGARRAAYEARWALLAAAPAGAPLASADVPWLPAAPAEARPVVLFGAEGAEAARRRVRAELMRWHPDKFGARLGARLAPAERPAALERVKAVAQMLTQLAREVAAEG